MKTYLKAFRLKRFWLLLLLPAAFLLDFAARQSADFAEWYAVTIYPVYAQFFSAITGVFPFSVGEFCLIALVLFILAYLIHGVYKLIRHKEGRFAYFVRFLSIPVLIVTCISFLCVTNYGTNSFAAVSGLTVRESSAKELYDVCAYLINEANTLRENLPEDERTTVRERAQKRDRPGFLDRSPTAAVRRKYRKTLLHAAKEPPARWMSPAEAEAHAKLQNDALHIVYEKARYSEKGCTKDDLTAI